MSVGKRVTFQGADFIGLFYFEWNCQNEVGNIAILVKRSCKNLVEFFSKYTRMAIMPILASEALFHENKKFQLQNATLVLNHWTSDSKSNMLLSTLTWHLLVKLRL